MNPIISFITNWILPPLFFFSLFVPTVVSIVINLKQGNWRTISRAFLGILFAASIIYLDINYGFLHSWNDTSNIYFSFSGILLWIMLGFMCLVLYLISMLLALFLSLVNENYFGIETTTFPLSIVMAYIYLYQNIPNTYFGTYLFVFTGSFVVFLLILITLTLFKLPQILLLIPLTMPMMAKMSGDSTTDAPPPDGSVKKKRKGK